MRVLIIGIFIRQAGGTEQDGTERTLAFASSSLRFSSAAFLRSSVISRRLKRGMSQG